jgi:hypothetical protein
MEDLVFADDPACCIRLALSPLASELNATTESAILLTFSAADTLRPDSSTAILHSSHEQNLVIVDPGKARTIGKYRS